jgi:hypothetical protein
MNEWNEEKKRGGRKWFTGVCLLKMVFFPYSLEGLFLYFISWYKSQQEN